MLLGDLDKKKQKRSTVNWPTTFVMESRHIPTFQNVYLHSESAHTTARPQNSNLGPLAAVAIVNLGQVPRALRRNSQRLESYDPYHIAEPWS